MPALYPENPDASAVARLNATGQPWAAHYNPHGGRGGPAYAVTVGGATGAGATLEDATRAALDRLAGQRDRER